MTNRKRSFGTLLTIFRSHRAVFDNRSFHPVREWMIGLLIAFIIVVVGGAQSAFMFVVYRNISTDSGTYEGSEIKYNRTLVERSLEAYGKKKEAYDAKKEVPAERIVVPFIPAVLDSDEDTVASSTEEEIPTGESEPVLGN